MGQTDVYKAYTVSHTNKLFHYMKCRIAECNLKHIIQTEQSYFVDCIV